VGSHDRSGSGPSEDGRISMSTAKSLHVWKWQRPLLLGASVFSALWISAMTVLAVILQSEPNQPPLTLNEWGDFLAGAFSPLGFIWLVVGYLQSSFALQLQGQELQHQVEELRHSVEAQRTMASVALKDHELAQAQSRAEKRAAQPVFVPAGGGSSSEPSGLVRQTLKIQNLGKPVSTVTLHVSGGIVREHVGGRSHAHWQAGETKDVALIWDPTAPQDFVSNLRITYRDSFGDEEYQDLTLARPASGKARLTLTHGGSSLDKLAG